MQKKKPATKSADNVEDKKVKTLDELKERINQRYEDIEHNFYLIGLDLIKVNMYVKNFRKWVKDNTQMDVSTAYTLMRLVKRDKELSDSKKYKAVRPKISLFKLIRLLKYPADFVDRLDFGKEYEAPGGKKFTLIDMPRDLFTEVIAHEYKMATSKNKDGDDDGDDDSGIPMDNVIISQAKDKLDKLLGELQTIFTVLSEIKPEQGSKETIDRTIEELESINSQAQQLNNVVAKILSGLRKGAGSKAA